MNGYAVNAMPTAVTEPVLSVAVGAASRREGRSRRAGYAYADGETAAQWFAFHKDYDLLILDWMLTKVSRLITAVFMYLNHICRKGTALLCPYCVVYLPENSCKSAKFMKAISSLSNHR